METKTLSIKKEKLETLKELSKQTGLAQSLLIRMAIDDLLKNKEKLRERLFPIKGNEITKEVQ